MLSRLLTRKEQLLLAGVVVAVCVGGVSLYVHERAHTTAPIVEEEKMPPPTVQPLRPPTPASDVAVPPAPASAPLVGLDDSEPGSTIAVAVAGAVERPGVYDLETSSRVEDLVRRAGGARPDADLGDINLAAPLLDGTTLTIPVGRTVLRDGTRFEVRGGESASALNIPQYTNSGCRPETAPAAPIAAETPGIAAPSATSSPTAPQAGLIDINTATQAMLETIPGIGPKLAQEIIAYRTKTPFRAVEDLDNVSGIGEKRLEQLRPHVTVR